MAKKKIDATEAKSVEQVIEEVEKIAIDTISPESISTTDVFDEEKIEELSSNNSYTWCYSTNCYSSNG